MKKTSLVLAALVMVLSLALTACGSSGSGTAGGKASADLPESVQKAGVIVFASDTTYPPMESIDDNKKTVGFDVDLVEALATKLGVTAKVETTGWDALLPGLKAHRYDAVISSMNVTADRLKEVDFVTYTKLTQVFVVPKGAAAVKTVADLAGKNVAVQKETTSADIAKGAAGVKHVGEFESFTDTFLELKAKRADVVIIDEPVGAYYATKEPNAFEVTGNASAADPVGIAVAKDNAKLTAALNKALADIKKDGTFGKISKKWFGTDLTSR